MFSYDNTRDRMRAMFANLRARGKLAGDVGKGYAYAVAGTPARVAGYARAGGHYAMGKIEEINPMTLSGHAAAVASSVIEDAIKKSLDLQMMKVEDQISGHMDVLENRMRRTLARRIQTAQAIATRKVKPLEE